MVRHRGDAEGIEVVFGTRSADNDRSQTNRGSWFDAPRFFLDGLCHKSGAKDAVWSFMSFSARHYVYELTEALGVTQPSGISEGFQNLN